MSADLSPLEESRSASDASRRARFPSTPPRKPPISLHLTVQEAVCCDVRARPFAEPQFLFLAPDIALFDKLPASGAPTTFYDSVCARRRP